MAKPLCGDLTRRGFIRGLFWSVILALFPWKLERSRCSQSSDTAWGFGGRGLAFPAHFIAEPETEHDLWPNWYDGMNGGNHDAG